MKLNKYFLLAAVALFSVALTSCSSDDDDDNNTAPSVEFDSHGVDLGLPSGTIWADQNVGASKPEDFGGYYAWGANRTYSDYTRENYQVDFATAGNDWGGISEFDAATLTYGGGWRTPSAGDFSELILNTTKEWTELNGVKGLKLTAENGKSIFLPAAGYAVESNKQRVGFLGAYVTSSIDPGYEGAGIRAEINAGGAGMAGYYGFHGGSIRAVKRK